jgi:heat shock protein HslJ
MEKINTDNPIFTGNFTFMKNISIVLILSVVLMGCSNTKKASSKNYEIDLPSQINLQLSKTMLQNGIDFFAQGNQPTNWQLTINYDDTVRFNTDDGLALKFAYNQPKKEFFPEKTVYTVKLKGGDVIINISEKTCTVATIKEVFKKEVSVTFNNTIYTGCGKFLADDNLNNKWSLEKIGNTVVNTNDYHKIPVFDFNLIQEKISGNDGCNSFGGKIEVQGKRIKFSQLISTRMACNKKSIEKIMVEQISGQFVSYYFKNGRLYLYLPDDSLMIFRKEIR